VLPSRKEQSNQAVLGDAKSWLFVEVVLVVVHPFREVAVDEWIIRIISTWKATKSEVRQYEDNEI
jgi:uncharacterized DUF497 family protein